MPIRGQSRRAQSLGGTDPRARRAAQAALSEGITTAAPVGIDSDGRVTLVKGAAMVGDIMRWNGKAWEPRPLFTVTPTKTSAYRAKAGEVVMCNPTGAGFAVTLEQSSAAAGLSVVVKNHSASANAITITASGQDTIDGAATYVLAAARAAAHLWPVTGGWIVV